MSPLPTADLAAASAAVDAARSVVASGVASLAAAGGAEVAQVPAYDVAHAASAVEMGSALLDYGSKGDVEARITCAFVADAVADLAAKLYGRETTWGVEVGALDRKSTRLNSSHANISYAVFCLKKKKQYTVRVRVLSHRI